MKVSDAIETLKAFFLDILGYFIPGFYTIIVLSYFINPITKFKPSDIGLGNEWNGFLIVFFSYVIGYVVYSISDIIDPILLRLKFLKFKNAETIEKEIEVSYEVEITKVALIELFIKKDDAPVLDTNKLNAMRARNLRSIVMSYIPESDTKIYTFMFRSELCKNISAFSFFYGVLSLFICLLSFFLKNLYIIKTDLKSALFYFLLIICSYFLTKTRYRFLAIAYKIPFSIFLAKYFKIK